MLEVTIKILMEKMVDYVVPLAVVLSITMASPPILGKKQQRYNKEQSWRLYSGNSQGVKVSVEDNCQHPILTQHMGSPFSTTSQDNPRKAAQGILVILCQIFDKNSNHGVVRLAAWHTSSARFVATLPEFNRLHVYELDAQVFITEDERY